MWPSSATKLIAKRVVEEVEGVTCKRAKPYNLQQKDQALTAAKERIGQLDERLAALRQTVL